MLDAGDQRAPAVAVVVGRGHGRGAAPDAVVGAVEGDELRAAGVGAGELDRRLDGVAAGLVDGRVAVAGEALGHDPRDLLGELDALGVGDVRGVHDDVALALDGGEHLGVIAPDGVHGHAGGHVDVHVAVGVLDGHALALLEDDGEAPAAAREGLVLGRLLHERQHLGTRCLGHHAGRVRPGQLHQFCFECFRVDHGVPSITFESVTDPSSQRRRFMILQYHMLTRTTTRRLCASRRRIAADASGRSERSAPDASSVMRSCSGRA